MYNRALNADLLKKAIFVTGNKNKYMRMKILWPNIPYVLSRLGEVLGQSRYPGSGDLLLTHCFTEGVRRTRHLRYGAGWDREVLIEFLRGLFETATCVFEYGTETPETRAFSMFLLRELVLDKWDKKILGEDITRLC